MRQHTTRLLRSATAAGLRACDGAQSLSAAPPAPASTPHPALWTARREFTGAAVLRRPAVGRTAVCLPPKGTGDDDAGAPAVAAALVEELRLIIARSPDNVWCPVSDVYAEVPAAMRRQHVRPHRTLLNVLEKVRGELGIQLSTTGVWFAKGSPPPEESQPTASAAAVAAGGDPRLQQGAPTGVRASGAVNNNPSAPISAESVFSPDAPAPVDVYYDAGLRDIPPPPADFDVTPSALPKAQASADGAVLALSTFVSFIPPFFIPLSDALANMPGYTEAHVAAYLNTSKAMEMVQVGGVKYVRLYGGYAKIRLDGCEEAEATFAHCKPDLALASAFVEAFGGIEDQWMPLNMLLHRAGPAAVARLPFQGPAAITYFAQMQHIFGFSVNSDGVTSSVLLRRPGFGGLEAETTPTPKSFNHLLHMTPLEGAVDVQQHILPQLPAELAAEVAAYYKDIYGFFNAHAPVFFLSEDRSVVMRTSYKRRLHIASLPLEEQLRIATERRDKLKIRTLRRRIAFRDNPSHPFHDPDNLAREVAKYLPRKGFVTMKVFLKKHVPEELLFFMPKKMYNFFENYPQHFQQFEFQQAGTWALSKPGQPLPRGVIRKDFSEEDLLSLVAEYLQQKGSRSCTTIFLHLPRGAQEMVRKRHGGLYYFAEKYPQYFNVVLGSDSQNAQSSAVVHLVQLPVHHSSSHGSDDSGAGSGEADGDREN